MRDLPTPPLLPGAPGQAHPLLQQISPIASPLLAGYGASPQNMCRELTSIGKLLSEQDGRLVSLLGQRGPADEDSHSRVWIALLVLTRSLVLAADLRKQQSEGGEDAAVALLGATRLLPSSGRLALAAAVRPDSSLSADLRRKLLQRNLAAARAACELLSISGSGRLLRAATKAFDPAAATMWLQLATSGLLSLATGGPLAATLEPGKHGLMWQLVA